MRWLKLHFDARNDAKLKILSDAQFRVWFNLLCFAGEQINGGLISNIDRFVLAAEVAGGNVELLDETIIILQKLKIVEEESVESVRFVNFEKRQYDKPSDTPEKTSERKRRQREREKETKRDTDESPYHADSTPKFDNVTPCHAEVTPNHALDTDTEVDTDKENVVVNAPGREEVFQEVLSAIQQIKIVANQAEQDLIVDMIDHYPRDWLIEAIKIAVNKPEPKVKTFNFVDGILANWRRDGFKDTDKPWEGGTYGKSGKSRFSGGSRVPKDTPGAKSSQADWKNEPEYL